MFADFRYALRGFRHAPGLACIAILSLALGIGANTAMFTLVNAILLRALPVREPDRLAALVVNTPRGPASMIPAEQYREIRDRNTVFEGFAGATFPPITILGAGGAERVSGLLVSGNFFKTLGVNAMIGRVLTGDDEGAPVCVLGYGLWQRRFARDRGMIGRRILINGSPFTVIGVTPREFIGIGQDWQVDLSIPLKATGMSAFVNYPLQTFGRLKRGMSAAQAQASLDVLYHQLASAQPFGKMADLRISLDPGNQGFSNLRKRYQKPVLLLMGVVGLVLLIACGNIANLLLARASGRAKEIAVRLALGAGRGRLIRQLLAESLLLTMSGAALGVALAYWIDHALIALAPQRLEGGASIMNVNPDWRVLLFTLAVAVAVGVVCGIAPAIQSTRPNLAGELKGVTGVRAPGRFSFTNALVVVQVVMSLVLLTGGGLFLRSLRNLRSVDLGLDPGHLVVLTIDSGSAGYTMVQSRPLFQSMVERARSLPGTVSASLGIMSPLSGAFFLTRIRVPGYQAAPGEPDLISTNWIGSDYFQTLGTAMVAGRALTDDDGRAAKVAVVNEKTAEHFWPRENPLGKHVLIGDANMGTSDDCEIVGVVEDVRSESLRQVAKPTIYLPFRLNRRAHMTLHVRVSGDTARVTSALLGEIRGLDSNLPPTDVTTMAAQIDRTMLVDRLMAFLTTLFGGLGVVLAAGGLYGVMAFAVTARTREIGIRIALGAGQVRVLMLVMAESGALIGVGLALGLPVARWVSRGVEASLYGVSATDPWTYFMVAIVLAAAAWSATWIPARRASRVDPMVALRYE